MGHWKISHVVGTPNKISNTCPIIAIHSYIADSMALILSQFNLEIVNPTLHIISLVLTSFYELLRKITDICLLYSN